MKQKGEDKIIYIVRHGETDYNKRKIVQGRSINASINEKGKEQAKAFYDAYKDEGFEIVYTSSLKRTQETVEHFINNGLKTEAHETIDEISWGEHEGIPLTEENRKAHFKVVDKWLEGDYDICLPSSESPNELQARLKVFIEYLKHTDEQKILICSHGRAMRAMLCTMLDRPLKEMDEFPHQNLSLYVLKLSDNQFELIKKNDTEHLKMIAD